MKILDSTYTMKPVEENNKGILYTLLNMEILINDKFIIPDYDGIGFYGSFNMISNVEITKDLKYKHLFTHVWWYNK